jgi:serralysin
VLVNLETGMGSYGTAAGDTLISIENLHGSSFVDRLIGNAGSNTLNGAGGNDILKGGGGIDQLFGGTHDDILQGGAGADTLNGGDGNDTANYASSPVAINVQLAGGSNWGGDAEGDTYSSIENITGSAYADLITGDGGNNVLSGQNGDDYLRGGAGADNLQGGAGSDTLGYYSSATGVTVSLLLGSASGGDAEGDVFSGMENLQGSNNGADTLDGDNGRNSLLGYGGVDTLRGLGSDDILDGGMGGDVLLGGAGIDQAWYNTSPEAVTVSLLTGHGSNGAAEGDTLDAIEDIYGSPYDDTLVGNDDTNTLEGAYGNDTLKGFGGTDSLHGGEEDDILFGMDQDDYLDGDEGNDTLNGGGGADNMYGDGGDDTYIVDDDADVIHEMAAQGSDTVRASVSYTLAAAVDVEIFETTNQNGTAAINLTGNTSGSHIIGNNGANTLDGGGGTDELEGRGGNDIYIVDGLNDSVIEFASQGIDEVRISATWTLTTGADIELLRTTDDTGTTAIDLTGNSSGNVVRGNNGNNIINGGGGDDELTGLGGQDAFLFNTLLDEQFNIDAITDFDVADDTIWLDQDIFSSSLGLGNISAGELVIGNAALDANDRIIYDSNTGALFYDSDGVGGTAAIQFAELSPGLALTYLDFLVV